jgi:hypothetical protein
MPSAQHAKLIQQTLRKEEENATLSKLDDNRQLEIYRLVLLKIREQSERHIPREIPFLTLKDSEEALNELSMIFVYLSMTPIGKNIKVEDDILPKIEQALSSVTQAVSIREKVDQESKKEVLPQEYTDCVIRFRRLVILAHEYLRDQE